MFLLRVRLVSSLTKMAWKLTHLQHKLSWNRLCRQKRAPSRKENWFLKACLAPEVQGHPREHRCYQHEKNHRWHRSQWFVSDSERGEKKKSNMKIKVFLCFLFTIHFKLGLGMLVWWMDHNFVHSPNT